MIREINLYSASSKYGNIHPVEKLLVVLVSLIGCSYTENKCIILGNIILFSLLNILAKNPFKVVKKFISIVGTFFLFTAITLLWEGNTISYILLLVLRVINGAISISFLALTTPINHIVALMSKFDSIRDVADIIKSMERFLMLVEDDCEITFKAMKSRAGFSGFKKSVKDFGNGLGIIFRNVMIRWKDINLSLKNRCYCGKHSYCNNFTLSKKRISMIAIYVCTMVVLCYLV